MRKQIGHIILLLIAIFIVGYRLISVNVGFNTTYDEAFFLLSLRDAYNGVIYGETQWNLLMIHLFPYLNLYDKAQSYLANILLGLTSVGILTIITYKLHPAKGAWLRYLSLYMLSLTLFLYENQELTYVSLQMFFLTIALAFLVWMFNSKKWQENILCAFIVGNSMAMSFFTIIPSAILILLVIFILIIWKFWKQWKICGITMASGIIGIISGFFIFHFFITDLNDVFAAMYETAQSVTTLHRGYDPLSFIIQIGFVLRDWLFCACMCLGTYYFVSHSSSHISSSKLLYKAILSALYMAIIILYAIYQRKPQISPALLFSGLIIISCFALLRNPINLKHIVTFDSGFKVILFFFPLIASIGTNIYLGQRMGCFMFSWVLLLALMCDETYQFKHAVWLASCLAVLLPSFQWCYSTSVEKSTKTYFDRAGSPIFNIMLTSKQVAYFEQVDSVLSMYDFDPKEDVVLGLNEDFATLYAFNVQKTVRPYQYEDVIYTTHYDNLTPRFIFIAKWERDIIYEATNNKWSAW